jgi:hypothetical protein
MADQQSNSQQETPNNQVNDNGLAVRRYLKFGRFLLAVGLFIR